MAATYTFDVFSSLDGYGAASGDWTGLGPIFGGAADFDLELLETRTFDGRVQELVYRPTLH